MGEDGRDKIYGGKGDDELSGGKGNDTLVGVAGRYDCNVDTLTGGAGSDRFVVGDYHGNFYNFAGDYDYALITDMSCSDKIVFDRGTYTMGNSPVAGVSGTAIYQGYELVAIVQGVSRFLMTFEDQSFTTTLQC